MVYQTVIRNGMVIDPSQRVFTKLDVAVSEGKIAGLYPAGSVEGEQVLDAAGAYVSPGWIDLHAHVFPKVDNMGLAPDAVGVKQGVATVIDAGSAGEEVFADFVQESVRASKTRVLAWLNVSAPGLTEGRSELADLNRLNLEKAWKCVERYRDIIVGIKVRMSGSVVKGSGIAPLVLTKALAGKAGLPVMVHVGNAPPRLGDILDLLTEGDVLTHAFHGKPGGILAADGNLIAEAASALRRGVRFDVGHGSSSFSFEAMIRAKALGIHPYSVSTDIYKANLERGPVYSLALTMTKFLALGYRLERIVEWTTAAPARAIHRQHEIGTLRTGSIADITVFKITNQQVALTDAENRTLTFDQVIQPIYTIISGESYPCMI